MDASARAPRKVQTNLKLSAERAAALDVAAAVEGKEKAAIVEEALRIREELLGADYRALIDAALKVRFAQSHEDLREAVEAIREEAGAGTPGEYASADLVLAKLRSRTKQPA